MNSKKKVGIIGYGGRMGKYLVDALEDKYFLRLGQRHTDRESIEGNKEYMRVDIFDAQSLHRFAEGLDILVNCAGPSYKIGAAAAKAVYGTDTVYIDAFGGAAAEIDIDGAKGTFILSAGSFPGFSGVVPLYIAEKYFDRVDSFTMISENNEESSYGAFYDLVMSSVNGFGKSGYMYADGNIVKCSDNVSEYEGFEEACGFADYINTETIGAAGHIGASSARWLNVQSTKEQSDIIMKITMEYLRSGSEEALDKAVREAVGARVSTDNIYKIACDMTGEKNGMPKSCYCIFEFPDSYCIGAHIISEAIHQALEKEPQKGVIWAYRFLDPIRTLYSLHKSGIVRNIKFSFTEKETEEEEGEL